VSGHMRLYLWSRTFLPIVASWCNLWGMSREERKKGPKTCLDWTLLRLSSFKWDKQRGTVEEPGVSNLTFRFGNNTTSSTTQRPPPNLW
jgi:hypothetical protein